MLTGSRVTLDIVTNEHGDFLYGLFADPRGAGVVKYHGATPGPDEVGAGLWDHVLAQFIVSSRETHQPFGLVVLSSPNFVDRYCFLSIAAGPLTPRRGLVIEGAILCLSYAFAHWDFRKIYLDVTAPGLSQFARTLGRYAELEGRLRHHQFIDGAYVDLYKYAIYADVWRREAVRLHRSVGGSAPVAPRPDPSRA
jgi:RimJ/RimL family protein N-acetyltransferase